MYMWSCNFICNVGTYTSWGDADISHHANHVHLQATTRPVWIQWTCCKPPPGCVVVCYQPPEITFWDWCTGCEKGERPGASRPSVCVDLLFSKHSAGCLKTTVITEPTKSAWMQRLLRCYQRMETSLPWRPFNPNPQQLLKDANHPKKIRIRHICQAHLFQMQPTRAQSRWLFMRLSKISSVLYITFSLSLDMLKTDWTHNFTLMVYNLHWCMLIINNYTLVHVMVVKIQNQWLHVITLLAQPRPTCAMHTTSRYNLCNTWLATQIWISGCS